MAKWQNDKMTKWQNDKMTKWQNDKNDKNDKMAKWQNDKMTKWQNDSDAVIILPLLVLAKSGIGQMSVGQMFSTKRGGTYLRRRMLVLTLWHAKKLASKQN